MTTTTPARPDEPTIGPLTATEWLSFFLLDDDNNPLPPCCAAISEVRDAIFDVLRSGPDAPYAWLGLVPVWHIVESHLDPPVTDPRAPAALRKLHRAYIFGHEDAHVNTKEAKARMFQQDPEQVRTFIAAIPGAWNLDTAEGRIGAAARVGGDFVAYVYDPAERSQLARELATAVAMTYEDVALLVDAARCGHHLPWQPAEGARVS
jgi:hypothetical protein